MNRVRFRYSLFGLLLAILVVAVAIRQAVSWNNAVALEESIATQLVDRGFILKRGNEYEHVSGNIRKFYPIQRVPPLWYRKFACPHFKNIIAVGSSFVARKEPYVRDANRDIFHADHHNSPDDTSLDLITKLPCISRITLQKTRISSDDIQLLGRCQYLRWFQADEVELTIDSPRFPQLDELLHFQLTAYRSSLPDGFAEQLIGACPHLEGLALFGGGAKLANLATAPSSLRSVYLNGFVIGDDFLDGLPDSIVRLELPGCSIPASIELGAHLGHLKRLTILNLTCSNTTDENLVGMDGLPLNTLVLQHTKVTSGCLPVLSRTNLQQLDLRNTAINAQELDEVPITADVQHN